MVGVDNFIATIQTTPWYIIPIFLAFTYVAIYMSGINSYLISKAASLPISRREMVHIYYKVWALSLLAPSKLGELSLAYFLKKKKVDVGTSLAIIFIDKAITFIAIFGIGIAGIFFFSLQQEVSSVLIIIVLLIGAGCFLLFTRRGTTIMKKIATFFLPKRIVTRIQEYSRAVEMIVENKSLIVANSIVTITRIIFTAFILFLAFLSINSPVPYGHIFLTQALISLIGAIPITLSGLGLREGSAVFFYSLLGVAPEKTLVVYLSLTIANYLMGFFIFLTFRRENERAMTETHGKKEFL